MRVTWLIVLLAIMFVLSATASASPISEHKGGKIAGH